MKPKLRVHKTIDNVGLFSSLDTLLSTLAVSEQDGIPTYVDWTDATNYLDEPGNLFDHLFEQPFGIRKNDLDAYDIVETVVHSKPYWIAENSVYKHSWNTISAERIRASSRLFQKYITVRPEIVAKAQEFFDTHLMEGKTLGVHLRGTDKRYVMTMAHAPSPMVSSFVSAAFTELKKRKYTHLYCISDDQKMLDTFVHSIRQKYPAAMLTIVYPATQRSTDGRPLHMKGAINKKLLHAKSALEESLILSMCSYIIKTSSNLSMFSVFMRPNVPFFAVHTIRFEQMRRVFVAIFIQIPLTITLVARYLMNRVWK